jgi:hypothetical protein
MKQGNERKGRREVGEEGGSGECRKGGGGEKEDLSWVGGLK